MDSVPTKFDAIVVGAGPAGSTAAYTLAKKGFRVLLVERGRIPGSKNIFGGRVYSKPLEEIYPDFVKEAPIQRWVTKERISIVKGSDLFSLDFEGNESTSFICYLTELADWMARKAEEAGAVLLTEITVDSLLVKDGAVKGIRVGEETLEADVVIDAEGINRLLLERAGFVSRLKPNHVALGVKETIKLPNEEIEKRFGLEEKRGLAWILMGDLTSKTPGGAFIYTNDGAISMGIVLLLGHAVRTIDEHVSMMVERMRLHPVLRKYFRDGNIVEYSAHLIPEATMRLMPSRLYHDGLLIVGDAGGFLLNVGYSYRGVDFSAYSGYLAAQAVEKAHKEGGFTADKLVEYDRLLRESFVMKQLIKFKKVYKLMRDPMIFERYPELVNDMAKRLFLIEYDTPTVMEAIDKAKKELSWITLLLNMYRLVSSI
jgi:electron transfer flavoprotein-quinone oxidoreductase